MNTNYLEGIRCPKCHFDSRFRVKGYRELIITDTTVKPDGRSPFSWDCYSECECFRCHHYDQFWHFHIINQ